MEKMHVYLWTENLAKPLKQLQTFPAQDVMVISDITMV